MLKRRRGRLLGQVLKQEEGGDEENEGKGEHEHLRAFLRLHETELDEEPREKRNLFRSGRHLSCWFVKFNAHKDSIPRRTNFHRRDTVDVCRF